MLSNVAAKSNILLLDTYQKELEHISAIELRDIYLRCPHLGISFDPSRSTLTPTQRKEWEARLFWGDKAVSLADDGRGTGWLFAAARDALPGWPEARASLDVEQAIEWLWLCTMLLDAYTRGATAAPDAEEVAKQVLVVLEEVQERLKQLGFDECLQEQRLKEITGS